MADIDTGVAVLENKEAAPAHATAQLIRVTDRHGPANKDTTVMWQIKEQSLEQKLQAIKDLVKSMHFDC